jgi:hypothetical protein
MAADPRQDWRWQDILDFEAASARGTFRKDVAIRERFGLSPARYHQLLDRLLDEPEALEYDPMLVQRLRRLRESRRQKRFVRRLGSSR